MNERFQESGNPFVALAAAVLLASKAAIVAETNRNLITAHPLSTFAAVILLASRAAVVAEVGRIFCHI